MRSSGGRGGTPRGVHACAYPGPTANRLLRVACHIHACAYMLLACLCWSALDLCQERKKVFSECGPANLTMDKWEATYRNDRSSDRFVSEASASRVIYAAPGSTRVSAQPMTWQADETSVAVYNNPIASEVKSHRHSNIGINVHILDNFVFCSIIVFMVF